MSLYRLTHAQKRQLVGFLELICQELDLTESQFEDAKEKYEAVGKWLDSGDSIKYYGPRIIPQGSISLGTAVRPIGRNEFDIDLVCKLVHAGQDQDHCYICDYEFSVKDMPSDCKQEYLSYQYWENRFSAIISFDSNAAYLLINPRAPPSIF